MNADVGEAAVAMSHAASVRVRTPAATEGVGLLSMPQALAPDKGVDVAQARRASLMLGSSCAPSLGILYGVAPFRGVWLR